MKNVIILAVFSVASMPGFLNLACGFPHFGLQRPSGAPVTVGAGRSYTHPMVGGSYRNAAGEQLVSDDPETREEVTLPDVPTLPTLTFGVDPYLGIPAVVEHPNAHFLKPYLAERTGLRVRLSHNRFSDNQQDLIWVPQKRHDRLLLDWKTLKGLLPGDEFVCLDSRLYDFGVGTLFVKVKKVSDGSEGFTLLETLIGDSDPANDELWVAKDLKEYLELAKVQYGSLTLYSVDLGSRQGIPETIKQFKRPAEYVKHFSAGQGDSVHPLNAASKAVDLLFHAMNAGTSPALRMEIISAVETFFENYIIPKKHVIAEGIYAWPYEFEWNLNWGIKLKPPWYSCYANSMISCLAAQMYVLTKKENYKLLAQRSANFVRQPIEEGGGMYQIGGFRLPAEYVYSSPPLPNIRVLDGEMMSVVMLYNAARLISDSGILHTSVQQGASVAMQLAFYTRPDGNPYFAHYIEEMPPHYFWTLWSCSQVMANIFKDRRFCEFAKGLRKHIPDDWKKTKPL